MCKTNSLTMARRLKALREQRGLSHVSLSKALKEAYNIDISRDSLMSYEVSDPNHSKSYKNEGMRVEFLRYLADFYHVSADYLLGFTDDPSRHPCAADEIGLSVANIAFLKDPCLPTGRRFRKDVVYTLVNDLLDFCRDKGIYAMFQMMRGILSEPHPFTAKDPGYLDVHPLIFDEYIREKQLFVLPRVDAADYYSEKIGALIGHSLMEKYCMPKREAIEICADLNENGDKDGEY